MSLSIGRSNEATGDPVKWRPSQSGDDTPRGRTKRESACEVV